LLYIVYGTIIRRYSIVKLLLTEGASILQNPLSMTEPNINQLIAILCIAKVVMSLFVFVNRRIVE